MFLQIFLLSLPRKETFGGFCVFPVSRDGRSVFPPISLLEVFRHVGNYHGAGLFFFTDSPSGFPNSVSKPLRYPPIGWKTEFELEGINSILSSLELEILEIQPRFLVEVKAGKFVSNMEIPIHIFILSV